MEEEKKAPEITKVTSEKPKDPKKVEAGKKLARISKEAKEKKKRERMLQEKSNRYDDYSMYYLAFAGLVVAGLSLYYAKKDSDVLDKTMNNKKDIQEDTTVTIPQKPENNPRFDFL